MMLRHSNTTTLKADHKSLNPYSHVPENHAVQRNFLWWYRCSISAPSLLQPLPQGCWAHEICFFKYCGMYLTQYVGDYYSFNIKHVVSFLGKNGVLIIFMDASCHQESQWLYYKNNASKSKNFYSSLLY